MSTPIPDAAASQAKADEQAEETRTPSRFEGLSRRWNSLERWQQ